MKESQRTEWKRSWSDDHLRWVCGFANGEGGVLVIGRNDKGRVDGIPDAARLLEELPNKIRDLLGIVVEVNLRAVGGREYLEVVTPAYLSPISYRGHYFQRSGSTLQELKGAALDRFLLRRQGRTWDGVPAVHVANAFFRAGEIEAWGRGIQRIFQACRDAGIPEPQIRLAGHDLWLELAFASGYLEAVKPAGGKSSVKTPVETPVKTPVESPVKTPERILAALATRPEQSLAALALSIGKSLRAVERATARLVKEGKVRFVGPRKGGHWEVIP